MYQLDLAEAATTTATVASPQTEEGVNASINNTENDVRVTVLEGKDCYAQFETKKWWLNHSSKYEEFQSLFPLAIKIYEGYSFKMLAADVLAGVTVSVVLLPQAIAYAGLAGIPPMQMLVSTFYCLVLYALFGGSTTLAVGPDAAVSMIIGLSIQTVIYDSPALNYSPSEVASSLALVIGIMALLLSVMRCGFIDQILSGYLLTGFVFGVAITIIVEQLPNGLGLYFGHTQDNTIGKLISILSRLHQASVYSSLIFLSNLIFLQMVLSLKRTVFRGNQYVANIPHNLILVVAMIGISYRLDLPSSGAKVLGIFENSIPRPTLPRMDIHLFGALIQPAVVILLIGFIQCQVITRAATMKQGNVVNSSQELLAFGFMNTVGAFLGAVPTFGSLSRSRILGTARPYTTIANALGGVLVLVGSQLLVPLLQYLPRATLSAIVVTGALALIEFKEIRFAIQLRSWSELGMIISTFAITLMTSVSNGVLICIGLSALLIARKTTTSTMTVMGLAYKSTLPMKPMISMQSLTQISTSSTNQLSSISTPGETKPHSYHANFNHPIIQSFRVVDLESNLTALPLTGVLLLRIDVPIMFYNCGQLRATIESLTRVGKAIATMRQANTTSGHNVVPLGKKDVSVATEKEVAMGTDGFKIEDETDVVDVQRPQQDLGDSLAQKSGELASVVHSPRLSETGSVDEPLREVCKERREGLHTLVLDFHNCFEMDSAAIFVLKQILQSFEKQGVLVLVSGVRESHLIQFRKARMDKLLRNRMFASMESAVMWLDAQKMVTI